MKTTIQILTLALSLILFANLSSALIINSVDADTLNPGQEGAIRIEVENNLAENVEDVSLMLNFKDLPLTPIGSSEQSVDEIDEDDDEVFVFRIRSSSNTIPGNYEVPYTLQYSVDSTQKTKSGTIGVKVSANPDLTFTVNANNAVQNQQGTITLRIVNKGFYDARFVSVKIIPDAFTLLSENEVYIGSVDSDDFETATFDVLFKELNPEFTAIIEYKDFDNKLVIENVQMPIKVYSEKEALELGITKKSNLPVIIGAVVFLILIWILWRIIKKRRRMKKSMENSRERDEDKKVKKEKIK